MSTTNCRLLALGLIIIVLIATAACASRTHQVRHLGASISMLKPGDSERDVRGIMGPPDLQRTIDGGGEEWLYLERRQSRMKRTKWLGRLIGHEDYNLAVITLHQDRVSDLAYRIPDEAEYREYRRMIPPAQPW